ncbi:hypothetical protein HDU97_006754 [Phlyctochytrium planicorne]|nr:hypothetical protein HDU97_006754 [Phlyctochytrium planicorne]
MSQPRSRGVSDIAKMFDRPGANVDSGISSPDRSNRLSMISNNQHQGRASSDSIHSRDTTPSHSPSMSRNRSSSSDMNDTDDDGGVVYEDRLPVSRLSRIFDTKADFASPPPATGSNSRIGSNAAPIMRPRQLSAVPTSTTSFSPSTLIPKSTSAESIYTQGRTDAAAAAAASSLSTGRKPPPPPVARKPLNLTSRPNSTLTRSSSTVSNPFASSDDSAPPSPVIGGNSDADQTPPLPSQTGRVSERIAALSAKVSIAVDPPSPLRSRQGSVTASKHTPSYPSPLSVSTTTSSPPVTASVPLPTPKKKPPPPPPPSRPSSSASRSRHSVSSDNDEVSYGNSRRASIAQSDADSDVSSRLGPPRYPQHRQYDNDHSSSASSATLTSRKLSHGPGMISMPSSPSSLKGPMLSPSITMGRYGSSDSFSAVGSDDGSTLSGDGFLKREKIIKEIVETEKRFLIDMHTLKEIYVIPATEGGQLTPADCKTLFSNLDGVIEISEIFSEELDVVTAAEPYMIGEAFLKHLTGIETAYGNYCRNNEDAIVLIGELLSPESPQHVRDFLKECQIKLQGKTGAWDLSSLVIKPVQRVLKYPLLIKQLLKETPSSYPDYQNLLKCSVDVEKVAGNINEFKKRKDTVEKYVEGKSKINVMHGITKKFTRGVQELKQATVGGDITVETEYDEMVHIFDDLYKKISLLVKEEIRFWLRAVKEFLERQELVAVALEEVYEMGMNDIRGSGYKFVAVEYRKACAWLASNTVKQAESEINSRIIPMVQTIEKIFKDLTIVIKKRAKKKLDYERKRAIEAKGDVPDKALDQSAGEYKALHAELMDELPKFLKLAFQYYDFIIMAIVDVQTNVHMEVRNRLEPVAENLLSTRSAVSPSTGKRRSIVVGTRMSSRWPEGEVIGRWREAFEGDGSGELRGIVDHMTILDRWRTEVLDNPSWQQEDSPRRVRRAEKALSPKSSRKVSGGSDISPWFPKSGSSSPKGGSSSRRVSIAIVNASPMDSTDNLFHARASTTSRPSTASRITESVPEEDTTPVAAAPEDPLDEAYRVGKQVGFEVTVMYPFQKEMEDELDLEVGDRVWVDLCGGRGGDPSEDWWHGHRVDESFEGGYSGDGWFPASYAEV